MPIKHAFWKVAKQPEPLREISLTTEQQLEDMIVARLLHSPLRHRAHDPLRGRKTRLSAAGGGKELLSPKEIDLIARQLDALCRDVEAS